MYLPPLGSIGVAFWAGAPNNPRGGFFGGVILRRIIASFVSFCLVLGFVCSSVVSFAVAPLILVQAALASYVASTGYKLYVDNGTGADLLNLLTDLYDDYLDVYPAAETLLELGQNNYVYSDNSGNIIVTQTAADVFQSFCDWIASNYSVTVGGSSTSVIGSSSGDIYTYNGYEVARLVANTPIVYNGVTYYCTRKVCDRWNNPMYLASLTSGAVFFSNYYMTGSWQTLCVGSEDVTAYFILVPDRPYVADYTCTQYITDGLINLSTSQVTNLDVPLISDSTAFIGVPISSFVSSGSSAGLAVSLAQNVIDKAGDLAQDYVLVYDVGAAAGASASDIADAVVAGYDSITGVVPVTDSITAADVIDTPVQPYPDVDSLGLPQLGLALTTRFPFSIPWDISAIYSAISAPSEPPVKTFDLIPASVLARWGINANTSITIDLTDQKYDVLLAIIHWSCIIGFCFGLAVMTKRYVWTTGG